MQMRKIQEKLHRSHKGQRAIAPSKFCLLFALCIVILIGSVLLLFLKKAPQPQESMVVLYSYEASAGLSYEVQLKENDLFLERTLGEGMVYAASLVDHISILANAEFQGSSTGEISGEYTIKAEMTAYQGSAENRKTIYVRQFPLREGATQGSGMTAEILDQVDIDLKTYQEFKNHAEAILGGRPGQELRILFEGIFRVSTEFGEKEAPFSYSMTIPVSESLFSIEKPEVVKISDSIQESKTGPAVAPGTNLLPKLVLAVLSVTGLFALIFLTRPETEEEQFQRTRSNLMRKYGSRMVCLQTLPEMGKHNSHRVMDMEGLLRIADELQRPIYYENRAEEDTGEQIFYVEDRGEYYQFTMKPPSTP